MWYNFLKHADDALSTDYINNIHDEDLRKGVPPTTELIVYHGTSMKKFVDIMIHGSLDPTQSVSRKNYDDVTAGGIYVTANPATSAEMYAFTSAKNDQSDHVVIELVVPIGWIDKDPDDTRINDKGEMNDLGKMQGYVRRPISIKRIRQIKVYNELLKKLKPNPNNDILSSEWTAWMPVGKLHDLIQRSIQKGLPLAPEYTTLVSGRPRGLSRSPAPIDREQQIAEGLITLWHTFFEINSLKFEKVISWAYQNKSISDATQGVQAFMNYARPGAYEEFMNSAPDYYKPKPGEPLWSYLKRVG